VYAYYLRILLSGMHLKDIRELTANIKKEVMPYAQKEKRKHTVKTQLRCINVSDALCGNDITGGCTV
jgi:hypothetical protein